MQDALEYGSVVSCVCSGNGVLYSDPNPGTLFRLTSHSNHTLINRSLGVATYDTCVNIQHICAFCMKQ